MCNSACTHCLWSLRCAAEINISWYFLDATAQLREAEREKGREWEGEREREKDTVDNFAKREARRRAISTFTRCVTKKTEDAEETLIRAHSITRIKPPRLASRVFPSANSSFRPICPLSCFLLFFLRPTVRLPLLSFSLSAVFITHRRHGARLHYTHIHSTVASLEKSGIRSHSSADVASPYPLRIFQVSPSPLYAAFSCFRPFPFFSSARQLFLFFMLFQTHTLSLSLFCFFSRLWELFPQIRTRWVNRGE